MTPDTPDRYGFGKNWKRFLSRLNDKKIELAVESLKSLLRVDNLQGKTFLDIGNGSGLFSLAAIKLGAEKVHSFDYDQNSVDCALYLRDKFSIDHSRWTIEQGSVLDKNYLSSLSSADVVYSWGVLHHTGSMWEACENAASMVKPSGTLAIAIYNDQGTTSKIWTAIKKLYNKGVLFQIPIIIFFQLLFGIVGFFTDIFIYRRWPHRRYTDYQVSARGMSRFTDLLDWLGGYPFEVASPAAMFTFYRDRGFILTNMITKGGGLGCNEFVFKKSGA